MPGKTDKISVRSMKALVFVLEIYEPLVLDKGANTDHKHDEI